MRCTVPVRRSDGSTTQEPCGHAAADHATMFDADTYCRSCFGDRAIAFEDAEHAYRDTDGHASLSGQASS